MSSGDKIHISYPIYNGREIKRSSRDPTAVRQGGYSGESHNDIFVTRLIDSSLTDVRNLLKMVSLSNSGAELGEGRRKSDMMTDDIEYLQLCRAIAVGFLVMGFIGYIVKLIHIPM